VKDFAHYSVEAVQDAAAAAGKEGDKGRRRREGGEQGVAVCEKIHCGGGSRAVTHWDAAEGDKE
jgi:hypothetical protein